MSSYDRNRKRAAERAAARNAARDAGKTGVVPGVGYVTPRREKKPMLILQAQPVISRVQKCHDEILSEFL